MEFYEIILAIFIVSLGAVVQGSVGFGFALVASPLLVMLNPVFVPGPILFCGFFVSLFLTIRERNQFELKKISWAVIGRIIGSIIGASILPFLSLNGFSIFFGVLVIFAVILSSLGISISINRSTLLSAGFLSGFMGTTISIGGPPVALLFQNEKGPEFRSTISAFLCVGAFFSLVVLIIVGKFRIPELSMGLQMIPGVIIGFLFSKPIAQSLDQKNIRPIILAISGFSGLLILAKISLQIKLFF